MVKLWVPACLSFVVAVASVGACSSDGDGSSVNDAGVVDGMVGPGALDATPTDPNDGAADAAAALAASTTAWSAAFCGRISTCFPAVLAKNWGGLGTCTTAKEADLQARLGALGTGWTAATASACATALGTVECADLLVGRLPDACIAPAGTRAPATPCIDDGQCTTRFCNIGDRVDDDQPASCGFCDTKRRVVGDACSEALSCPAPLDCSPSLACADFGVKTGSPCNADTLFCNADATCIDGMCVADVTTSGATCDPTRTIGPTCAWSAMLKCGTTKTCEASDGMCIEGVAVCKPAMVPDLTTCPTSHP